MQLQGKRILVVLSINIVGIIFLINLLIYLFMAKLVFLAAGAFL